MPNPENIANQGFQTNPERINREGRPKKWVSSLRESGYRQVEINDCIQVLLQMDLSELKDVYENPKATILEKTVANALRKSLEKGSLYSIETLLSRVFGKPKETVDAKVEGEVTIEVSFNGENKS